MHRLFLTTVKKYKTLILSVTLLAIQNHSLAQVSCIGYSDAEKMGKAPKSMTELSGLAVSRQHHNLIWAHNDSGDKAKLYGINYRGKIRTKVTVEGIDAIDWEDIALGRCQHNTNKWCIYIGDIGDNKLRRDHVTVHMIEEPSPNTEKQNVKVTATMHLKYPNQKHNAEALIVDKKQNIFVITKDFLDVFHLYSAPFSQGSQNLKLEGVVNLSSLPPSTLVTAADYSPEHNRVILRTYASIFEYQLTKNDSLAKIIDMPWKVLDSVHEPQGEAIAYGPSGYWHLSEGFESKIWYFPCTHN